jgi:hypothetical protein
MNDLQKRLQQAELEERRKALIEEKEQNVLLEHARDALTDEPISLNDYLSKVMSVARVDLLDAKRALSRLRSYGEAEYKFGTGVFRRPQK